MKLYSFAKIKNFFGDKFMDSQVIHKTDKVVIHFGELMLKCGNRRFFEIKLADNVRASLSQFDIRSLERPQGRIVLTFKKSYDAQAVKNKLSRVFGVAGYAPIAVCEPTPASLEKTIVSGLAGREFTGFAVRARRVDKRFPIRSQEINENMGGVVLDNFKNSKVDLTNPEQTIFIELFCDRAHVYFEKCKGAGGLPVGTSGNVMALLSGGIDSPVAAWRMMRRGCKVKFVHFHSAPFTDKASQEKAIEIAEVLASWQCGSAELAMVPLGDIQKKIVTSTEEKYRVILYRRFMVRIAEELAKQNRCEALVTGEALGQVASQTLSNMATVDSVSTMPILRPLVGMDKQEIVDCSKVVGTYDLSIMPHQDCCQFLEPRNPVTHTKVRELEAIEKALEIEKLVSEGLTQVEWKDIKSPL